MDISQENRGLSSRAKALLVVWVIPIERKEQFTRLLLDRLNSEPWHAFDETYSSIRPPPGGRFIGLDLVYLH